MSEPVILLLDRADGMPAAPATGAKLDAGDPFAAGREVAWAGPAELATGRVAFAGDVEIARFPHNETIIVVAGRLTLTVAGSPPLEVPAGAGAVVARGTALRCQAAAGTRWIFCAASGEATAAPGVSALLADAALSPSAPPDPAFLIGPVPECRTFNAFFDQPARLRVGIWDSTPYNRVSRPHRLNELMHILEGSVDLGGADGSVTRVGKGDTVFVAQGAPCSWESRVHVAKFFVVQEVTG